jgi:hypothetical protein
MEVGADEVVETDTPDATEEDRVELEAEDEGDAVEEERREKRRKLKSRSSNAKWPGSSVVRTGATTLERLEPARRMGWEGEREESQLSLESTDVSGRALLARRVESACAWVDAQDEGPVGQNLMDEEEEEESMLMIELGWGGGWRCSTAVVGEWGSRVEWRKGRREQRE